MRKLLCLLFQAPRLHLPLHRLRPRLTHLPLHRLRHLGPPRHRPHGLCRSV
nr:MAG TPA: hypothetical protein [Caudoviricetes sp.]